MARTAIEDVSYELIKAHILNPEESPLNNEQQVMLDRVLSLAKVLDKNPTTKHALALHQAKYPDIGQRRAYYDLELTKKLFNTIHKFDYDFWQTWLINDIVANIQRARNDNTPASRRVIAMEHANLIKAIGEKPDIPADPKLTEKHQFYILIQQDNRQIKLDYNLLQQLPKSTLKELNQVLFAANEISDGEAEEIMNT